MIDLNKTEFKDNTVVPFNGGKAGIVEVTVSSIDKNNERNRWEITYQDTNGGRLRDFYNYLDPEHPKVSNHLKAQGMALRHLWNEIVGEVALPTFSNTTEMLDTIMTTLKSRLSGVMYRVAVDFGYGDRHNTNLNRKSYVPFLEKIVDDKTKLFLAKSAHLTPAAPTNIDEIVPKSGPAVSEGTRDWLSGE